MSTHSREGPGSLLRGLEILSCFTVRSRELSGGDLMRLTGMPQSTVWRLCQQLQAAGYLQQSPRSKLFRPGLQVLLLGYGALQSLGFKDLASGELEQLAMEADSATGLSTPINDGMLLLDRHVAPGAIYAYSNQPGETLPMLTSASGWAHLASLAPEAREDLLGRLEKRAAEVPVATRRAMAQNLADFPGRGFVVNEGHQTALITSLAAPVSCAGTPYAISCSFVQGTRETRPPVAVLGARMVALAQALSRLPS